MDLHNVKLKNLTPDLLPVFQVLRYFDYVFTGVFTFEMLIKVKCAGNYLCGCVLVCHFVYLL